MVFTKIKNTHVALTFLFGMLTTFIVLYAVQVSRAKRMKKQNTTLLKELKGRPTEENYNRLWNEFHICSSFAKPGLFDPYKY